MIINKRQGFGLIVISLIVAMILKIAPWPGFFMPFNPDWVLLTLIYWALASPEKTGIISAWTVGLLTDALTGRLLGQLALTYPLVIYFCIKKHKRLNQFPLVQQLLFILFLLLLAQFLVFWIENFHKGISFSLTFWLPAFSGTLIWPLIFTLMREVRAPRKPK